MSLGRAIATVGSFTLLSRIVGFVRDIVLSAVLGSGAVADAFFVAFKLPNFFRRLFAEGAFSAAFVPLFARELQGDLSGAIQSMKLAADDVQTLVVPGCAHWIPEEAPEETLAALTAFLAPYRDGPGS